MLLQLSSYITGRSTHSIEITTTVIIITVIIFIHYSRAHTFKSTNKIQNLTKAVTQIQAKQKLNN